MPRHVVDTVEAFPPGTHRSVRVGARNIAIWNVAGRFFALRDICPHQGGPLSQGQVIGQVRASRPGCYEYDGSMPLVRCPWHGWEYELATGQSWFDPGHNRVRAYDVSVEAGEEIAAPTTREPGPYVAETVPVFVEHDYVVLEL